MDPLDASIALTRFRVGVYRSLALAFHFPPRAEDLVRFAFCTSAAEAGGREALGRVLSDLVRLARETPAEAIALDWNDLFMVPGKRYTAPYESVYRDDTIEANGSVQPRTFGPCTQAVIAFYERIGLDIARTYTELPDYAGLELACLEFLCSREAELLESGADEQADRCHALAGTFLDDHLARWLPELAERIRKNAATDYYRALAAFLKAWVAEETAAPCART